MTMMMMTTRDDVFTVNILHVLLFLYDIIWGAYTCCLDKMYMSCCTVQLTHIVYSKQKNKNKRIILTNYL